MDKSPQPRLGTQLRMARMRLELTQEQVAKRVGFVPTVYGRIERGDMVPSVPKLRELCLALGVSADVLLSLSNSQSDSPGESPANAPVESADLRRLVMLIRDLSPDRFRLFRVALQTIAASDEE
ncbi:helix-turn-helix transcriptional regulator [Archangium minus]|uniref:Helix-turn-helix transcriptional regulator n=1 Tax=Archangium minus TaxID=83450 RepID=A0ABY9WVE2_9BACT|nr:helix-turn-helix transcriptional regulator [Archangium minus]